MTQRLIETEAPDLGAQPRDTEMILLEEAYKFEGSPSDTNQPQALEIIRPDEVLPPGFSPKIRKPQLTYSEQIELSRENDWVALRLQYAPEHQEFWMHYVARLAVAAKRIE